MADAADRTGDDEERAMAIFDQRLRDQRAADAATPTDPCRAVDCIDCGLPVPPARLKAAPSARRCVGCMAYIERSYRREPWT